MSHSVEKHSRALGQLSEWLLRISPPHADVCDADSDGSQIRWAVQPKLHARTETSLDSIENGSCGKGSVVTGLGNDEYVTRLTFCYRPSGAIFGGGGRGGWVGMWGEQIVISDEETQSGGTAWSLPSSS